MNLFVRKVNKIKEERKKERTHKYMLRKRKRKRKERKKILCVYYIKSE